MATPDNESLDSFYDTFKKKPTDYTSSQYYTISDFNQGS